LNSLGESVGPAHPGFDLGWFVNPSLVNTGAGFFTASMTARDETSPGNPLREHLCIFGSFDVSTGVLKMIKNMWGGDGDTEMRWGGIHGVSLVAGPWQFGGMNFLKADHGNVGVLGSSFDMPISQVNRAGFGSTASWDSNTALSGTEAYTCPLDGSLPTRYRLASMQALGYSGSALGGSTNCVQVRVTTPPCNASPNPTYTFPDGKTEKDHFPCTTPGFGVADATRSKLMDIQAGDWLWESRTGDTNNESFVVLSVTYNGTNDIVLWLLRWGKRNYTGPILFNDNVGDFNPAGDARPNGWYLTMATTVNGGASSMAIDVSAGASATWLPVNSQFGGCHSVIGAGPSTGLYSFSESCNPPYYFGYGSLSIPSMLFQAFQPLGASYPAFAGSSNGFANASTVQSYPNSSWNAGRASPTFHLDFRHLNPSFGSGAEFLGAGIGTRTLTPVGGTSKSYLITDGSSAGASDYKRLPLYGFGGHYLYKDVSGPATGNVADMPDYSYCRAFKVNECFNGSSVGNLYVTAPKAFIDGNCRSDQFTLPDPCVFQLSPYAGQVIQFRTDKTDSNGLTTRKFGYVHGMPGLQYQFSNCRSTPEGEFAFCVADWLDGVRSEWVSLRVAPMPKPDSRNRTTFIPIALNYQGSPGATNIRARFGYAENGGSLLRCTAYQAECTTEIPVSSPGDPYGFTTETVTRQNCAINAACTITIPAISNRMLYYVVDRLDNSGNIVASFPKQVIAVP
jgi:hypothetical protein